MFNGVILAGCRAGETPACVRQVEDANPWAYQYDSDTAAFAEELVTTPGEFDADTGMETVRVAGNIIEPGKVGTLFFRRPIRRTWDNLWAELCGRDPTRDTQRGVIVGNSRTGASHIR